MSYIFRCKTSEAYNIKVLAELLTNNLKTGCFEVSKEGITLSMFDHHRRTLVELNLDAENFSYYRFTSDTNMCLGLNLNHFHKMLKSIKKKDSLHLFILEDNPHELGIKTIPKENSRLTTSGLKIQSIQNIKIESPCGYVRSVIVPSSEFQKMCKDLSSIGSTNIKLVAKEFSISFLADADGILTREVSFGEQDESGNEDVDNNTYRATFATDQLTRITKIAGLGNNLQIYTGALDLPLLFKSNIGSLGKLSIYIKSKELSDMEMSSSFNGGDSDSE